MGRVKWAVIHTVNRTALRNFLLLGLNNVSKRRR